MSNGSGADATSLLSRNIKVDGELRGNENIKVEGFIKGLIELNGNVFVGNSGVVEADIKAENIVIEGKVTGTVTARNKLEIHPSGKLIGDFEARSIDIKEGALFEGRSHMTAPPPTKANPQKKR